MALLCHAIDLTALHHQNASALRRLLPGSDPPKVGHVLTAKIHLKGALGRDTVAASRYDTWREYLNRAEKEIQNAY
jgi:hypothetical protein